MKIGIAANEDDRRFSSSYEFPIREAVLYDVDLPPIVMRGLQTIEQYISSLGRIPIFNQTQQGHGNDYGLVFRIGETKTIDLLPDIGGTGFTESNLVARISFGMPAIIEHHGKHVITYKDSSRISRLHFNVYGARLFVPIEGMKDREEKKTSIGCVSEKIHFSLRWVDGTFDYFWNDLNQWLKEKDDDSIFYKPTFDYMRTTYCESREDGISFNGNYYQDLSGYIPSEISRKIERGEKILTLHDVEEKFGSKKSRVISPNLTLEQFLQLFPIGTSVEDARKAAGYDFRQREDFPHIGYLPALQTLSKFGDVFESDASKIPQMTMEEGVKYIFGKILPAMKNFTHA